MEDGTKMDSSILDALVAPEGPAAPAWLTRVHRHLEQLWPEAYVGHLADDLETLAEWLAAEGIPSEEEHLLTRLLFDNDRDAPRARPESGSLRFRWRGQLYRVVGVRARGPRYDVTYSWLAAPDRRAAEALVDALGRHAKVQRQPAMVFQDGDWEDAPRLARTLAHYCWEEIVLPEPTERRIRSAAELFFRSEAVYRDLDIPWKLGFLLVGPPGTGKTLTTKILANTCGVPFLYARTLNGYCENKPDCTTVRAMFQGARDRAPCLLCLEDLDSLVTDEVRSTFLNELDGMEEDYRGVLTVATTNHPERLDAALLHRPSRFDYRFEFPLPDEAGRRTFIHRWTDRLARLGYLESPGPAVEEVVRRSRGMSPAYLKRVLISVALRMHHLEERGDAAFARLLHEEVADAAGDRAVARRSEAGTLELAASAPVGFRQD
jgi:hypothetical protein